MDANKSSNIRTLLHRASVLALDTGICRVDGFNRKEVHEQLIEAWKALEVETSCGEPEPCVSHLALREYEREITAMLDLLGADAIRVREGGGPENLLQSLAVTIASLRHPKASSPQCDTKCFDWPRCECGRGMP
jgi:hypothetical protein